MLAGMYREEDLGGPLVISAFNRRVIALRVRDGTVAWQVDVGGYGTVRVHVTADRVIALGGELVEIEYATGSVVRRTPVTGITLLVVARRAFVSSQGDVTCVDLDDGKVLWKNDLPGTGIGAAALAAPGRAVQGDMG